jgi:hypothetical protein
MYDKPFDPETCDIGGQVSATNGLSDATNGLTDMKNAPCNRPLTGHAAVTASQSSLNLYVGELAKRDRSLKRCDGQRCISSQGFQKSNHDC